jgi:hypothetical protein
VLKEQGVSRVTSSLNAETKWLTKLNPNNLAMISPMTFLLNVLVQLSPLYDRWAFSKCEIAHTLETKGKYAASGATHFRLMLPIVLDSSSRRTL